MKRFHVHITVENLGESLTFYNQLFGAEPSVARSDYAKWMLDEPRVNFAISARGHSVGLNHFGFQADTPDELAALETLAQAAAGNAVRHQQETTCCYANSNKHWTIDPQGIAWEHFHTMSESEHYSSADEACCIPVAASAADAPDAGCCVPNTPADASADACCAPAEAVAADIEASQRAQVDAQSAHSCCTPEAMTNLEAADANCCGPATSRQTATSCCG